MNDEQIKEKLSKEEFRLRSLAEAKESVQKISDEIKAVLQKYGASLAEWNYNLYIIPQGFKVYSEWDNVIGVKFEPIDTGLKVQPYDWEHKIVKTLPTKTVK